MWFRAKISLFRVRGYLLIDDDWSLKVGNGKHNHDMTDELKGHKTVGRLNSNESIYLREMTNSRFPFFWPTTQGSSEAYSYQLRNRNGRTSTTIKHIYNARHMYRQSIRGPRTKMQHLMKSLIKKKYGNHCRKYPDFDDVRDIFWAHPDGLSCLTVSLRCLC
jgi:hypothetical protein